MNLFHVDAFTGREFAGNPAAVCLLKAFPSDQWLQSLGAEMNLSETACLHPVDDGYALRWFTPGMEVDLCGHATLAAAHVLWTENLNTSDVIHFESRSGRLSAHREGGEAEQPVVRLDFPSTPPQPVSPPTGLLEALGTPAEYVGRSAFDYLVLVKDESVVRSLKPDYRELRQVDARGVIVTAAAQGDQHDFVSRFFAPAAGVDEDPVTGSAHCCLAPFWAERIGRTEMAGFQASRRGGEVRVRLVDDRVHLIGTARTIVRGELAITPQ